VPPILFAGNRAIGVSGRFRQLRTRRRGGRFTVRAKHAVFVAGSVTWSPVLLAQSGVRMPALGHYFRAHPGFGLFGVYDDPVTREGWPDNAERYLFFCRAALEGLKGFGEELDNIVFPWIVDLAASHKSLEPRHERRWEIHQQPPIFWNLTNHPRAPRFFDFNLHSRPTMLTRTDI